MSLTLSQIIGTSVGGGLLLLIGLGLTGVAMKKRRRPVKKSRVAVDPRPPPPPVDPRPSPDLVVVGEEEYGVLGRDKFGNAKYTIHTRPIYGPSKPSVTGPVHPTLSAIGTTEYTGDPQIAEMKSQLAKMEDEQSVDPGLEYGYRGDDWGWHERGTNWFTKDNILQGSLNVFKLQVKLQEAVDRFNELNQPDGGLRTQEEPNPNRRDPNWDPQLGDLINRLNALDAALPH